MECLSQHRNIQGNIQGAAAKVLATLFLSAGLFAFVPHVGAQTISSAANQAFTAADPATLISPITITDDAVTPTILNKKKICLGAAYFEQNQ